MTQDFAGAPEASGAEALRIAISAAERAGALVRTLALPEIVAEAWRIHPIVQEFEAHQAMAWEYRANHDAMPPLLRGRLDESVGISAADFDQARAIAHRARAALAEIFDEVDVLLTFSAPGAAPKGLDLDRRSPFQPALDADGRTLRQRSRLRRRGWIAGRCAGHRPVWR